MSQHRKSHQDLERISRQFWPGWWRRSGISIRLSYRLSASPYKPQEQDLKNIVFPRVKQAWAKRDYVQVLRDASWTAWHCPDSLLRGMLKAAKSLRREIIINALPRRNLFERSLHRALRRQRGPLLRPVSRRIFNVHPAPPHEPKTRLVIQTKLLSQAKTGISFCAWMPDKRASAAILTCKLENPYGHVSQSLSWVLTAGEQTEVQAVLESGAERDQRLVIETEMMPPASNNYYASVLVEDLRLTP